MKRIIPVLASLTLSGCWLLNGPGGFRSSGDAADGESAYPTADTDGAGDTGMEEAEEGLTDEGSGQPDASDPTADTAISPQGDPCQELRVIEGTWYEFAHGWGKMSISLEEDGDTCAITMDGDGAIVTGTFHGAGFPLTIEEDGWKYHLYFKGELPATMDEDGVFHKHKILVHEVDNSVGKYYQ